MRTLLAALLAAAAPALAQPAVAPAAAPMSLDAAPGPEAPNRRVRLYMQDGQELTAVLVDETKDSLRVRVGEGAPFDISRASLRAVEDADAAPLQENYFHDPNLSRTFYAPTGFRLRAGEGYFSQKELLFSAFGYGVTDNVSVMVGSMLPIWFVQGGQNMIAGLKVGTDVNDLWHVAVGAQGFAFPGTLFSAAPGGDGFPKGFAFLFGTVTAGTPVLNVTLSAGEGLQNLIPFSTSNSTLIVVASASWRVQKYVALETENWLFPNIPSFTNGLSGSEPFMILNCAGVRLMNRNLAADLGLVRIPGTFMPMPWVDFTYSFGVQ